MGGFDSNNLASWTNGAWKIIGYPKTSEDFVLTLVYSKMVIVL